MSTCARNSACLMQASNILRYQWRTVMLVIMESKCEVCTLDNGSGRNAKTKDGHDRMKQETATILYKSRRKHGEVFKNIKHLAWDVMVWMVKPCYHIWIGFISKYLAQEMNSPFSQQPQMIITSFIVSLQMTIDDIFGVYNHYVVYDSSEDIG